MLGFASNSGQQTGKTFCRVSSVPVAFIATDSRSSGEVESGGSLTVRCPGPTGLLSVSSALRGFVPTFLSVARLSWTAEPWMSEIVWKAQSVMMIDSLCRRPVTK